MFQQTTFIFEFRLYRYAVVGHVTERRLTGNKATQSVAVLGTAPDVSRDCLEPMWIEPTAARTNQLSSDIKKICLDFRSETSI
jgi:hypothetical protein